MSAEAPIDRAKKVVNDRVMAFIGDERVASGEGAIADDPAPLFVGLPVTADESLYFNQISIREIRAQIARGVPLEAVIGGTLQFTLLVGIIAGMEAEQ